MHRFSLPKAIELAAKVKESAIPQCCSQLINRCIHFVHVNLHNRLKIESIADALHVSRDYLSSAFKKETGTSLHQYILNQKLEEAKHMLALGMSINETSYTLCFCNESHFIQTFRKNTASPRRNIWLRSSVENKKTGAFECFSLIRMRRDFS